MLYENLQNTGIQVQSKAKISHSNSLRFYVSEPFCGSGGLHSNYCMAFHQAQQYKARGMEIIRKADFPQMVLLWKKADKMVWRRGYFSSIGVFIHNNYIIPHGQGNV